MYFCTSHQFYLQKKPEKFRIPVLSTATGIRDDLFSPESLGKGLFFTVLFSHEKPSWLALLNRVSLIGILEFRCRVTGAEWILFSSFFSLPVSREAIVVVLTGISHHAKRWFFNSLLNFLLFLKSFFVCFYFSFESFFSENHFENIENCSAPKVCTHLRKAEAKWLFSFNDYGNAFRHKQRSEEECFRMLAQRHSSILLADFVRHFEFMLNLAFGKF